MWMKHFLVSVFWALLLSTWNLLGALLGEMTGK